MADRESRIISEEILSEDGAKKDVLRVRVSYMRARNRGFYLYVEPVTVEQHEGYKTESFFLFSGQRRFIEPAARFSEKRLDALAYTLKNNNLTAQSPAPMCDWALAIGAMRLQVLTARDERTKRLAS